MVDHRTIDAIAGEEMSGGCPVLVDEGLAYIAKNLAEWSGVVVHDQRFDRNIPMGAGIRVKTDGGIKVQLRETMDIPIAGIVRRFGPNDACYFDLRNGRPA